MSRASFVCLCYFVRHDSNNLTLCTWLIEKALLPKSQEFGLELAPDPMGSQRFFWHHLWYKSPVSLHGKSGYSPPDGCTLTISTISTSRQHSDHNFQSIQPSKHNRPNTPSNRIVYSTAIAPGKSYCCCFCWFCVFWLHAAAGDSRVSVPSTTVGIGHHCQL